VIQSQNQSPAFCDKSSDRHARLRHDYRAIAALDQPLLLFRAIVLAFYRGTAYVWSSSYGRTHWPRREQRA
jgi:hypothetical protein